MVFQFHHSYACEDHVRVVCFADRARHLIDLREDYPLSVILIFIHSIIVIMSVLLPVPCNLESTVIMAKLMKVLHFMCQNNGGSTGIGAGDV